MDHMLWEHREWNCAKWDGREGRLHRGGGFELTLEGDGRCRCIPGRGKAWQRLGGPK